jgi:NRAMP (natural resistance-associated macrophage protein)-like metal ion transporter
MESVKRKISKRQKKYLQVNKQRGLLVHMLKLLKKLFKKIGPGFITGAADDDPSGIATYSQTGTIFGFSQLWLALFSFPFMVVIQQMCGRIGMVTGKGLAGVIRANYSRPVLYFAVSLLVITNTINIGADLGAMAASAQMLLGLPSLFWLCLMTGAIILLEVFVTYKTYSKILKYLALTLFAYVLTAFIIKPDWGIIAKSTLFPQIQFSRDYLLNVVAILGTTISPYLFFWQASQEVEEEIVDGSISDMGVERPYVTKINVANMDFDTIAGMFFSQAIMFFIIITTAATLHANGITNIDTASQAAEALRPVAGNLAYLLFAAGIIGTGLLAVPILAGSSAYAVAETIGFKEGLSKKFALAPGFYGIISASTLIGMLISWLGINPFKALYYAAALNGIAAAPLMALVILIANNKNIMGKFVNKRTSNILGWMIVLVMAIAGSSLIIDLLKGLL